MVWPRRDSKFFGTSLQDEHKKPRDGLHEGERNANSCRAYGESHHIVKCQVFARWPGDRKWEAARQFGRCYRCLNWERLGYQCPNSEAYNIKECKRTLLPLRNDPEELQESQAPIMKGDGNVQTKTLNTIERHEERIVAPRTIRVILKHEK